MTTMSMNDSGASCSLFFFPMCVHHSRNFISQFFLAERYQSIALTVSRLLKDYGYWIKIGLLLILSSVSYFYGSPHFLIGSRCSQFPLKSCKWLRGSGSWCGNASIKKILLLHYLCIFFRRWTGTLASLKYARLFTGEISPSSWADKIVTTWLRSAAPRVDLVMEMAGRIQWKCCLLCTKKPPVTLLPVCRY